MTGLVAGMVLLVVGAQGAVRLLVDHENAGLLAWLPGGFGVRLACYGLAVAASLSLAGWGGKKASGGD
ncbi:hypothetical protein GCM10009677_01760 [Sphaerisporangium rubeum]